MGRKSSIERLPKPIKDRLRTLLRDGGMTLDEVIAELRAEFGEAPSRSALGRYRQSFEEALAEQREMESVSELWIRELKDAPQGKTGRLVLELLRTLAARSAFAARGRDKVDAKELATLARAFNLIEAGGKRNIELEREIRAQVREELLAEQTARLETVVKSGGLSESAAAEMRKKILGVG